MESIARRDFLGGAVGLLAAAATGGCATMAASATSDPAAAVPKLAYVGCYTTKERDGHGEGINVYQIDAGTGNWTHLQMLPEVNPSFLTFDRQKRMLYSAHGDGGEATAYRVDAPSGRLAVANKQPTNGKNGVSLAVDATNRFLVLANYSSGTVSVLPISTDGSLAPLSDLYALPGKPGPHKAEQASSHPHDVVFDPRLRFIVVPDKGLDTDFTFRLDTVAGKLAAASPPSVASRPGAGPRHCAFHPTLPYTYVINELDSTITTFRFDPDRGQLTPLQVITTLPPSFTGDSTTSEIAVSPSGRFVYGSNRGHDSLAIFSIDAASGVLAPVGWEPTQGKTPRFFAIEPSGTFLYAANQNSDTVVTFRIDQATGKLTPTGQVVKTGSPVCIVFR